MKKTISNIAWEKNEDAAVVPLFAQYGFTGVDIAPSKIWADPLAATDADIAAVRAWWQERGIAIAGAQSIHFGHPEFQMFQTEEQREQMLQFTARMIELCGKLGVSAIVFGSPKNRLRGALSMEEALDSAELFFRRLGEVAAQNNTHVCIEPNATDYGCDFINTAAEGYALVKRVNHPGFRLHLDSGNMTMMKENCVNSIRRCFDVMQHFHLSEPQLGQVGIEPSPVDHAGIAGVLKELHYDKWVSVEMRGGVQENNVRAVEQAMQFVSSVYA